jgi:phosphatidate cytidylyltransferase
MKSGIAIVVGAFILGSLLMALGSLHVEAQVWHARWTKFIVYFVIVVGVIGVSWLGNPWLPALMAVIVILGALEIASALGHLPRSDSRLAYPVWISYTIVGLIFLVGTWRASAGFVYLIVAAFDGFSQVSGQLLGRHKLAPYISPGKTMEGVIGGTAGALAVAVLARPMVHLPQAVTLELSMLICIAALSGDLAASWLKRRAGIKDYGNILRGHGGVLDRFDSFIAALAASDIALWFWGY